MGMAASQARFLGLTARKTNVEYEGQQINQQRTALGNQTANYYNQMLGMKVPVPPAIDDYTRTVYTFEDGSLKNTITSLIAGTGGNYTVSYLRQWVDDFAIVAAAPSIVTQSTAPTDRPGDTTYVGGDYMIGSQQLMAMQKLSSTATPPVPTSAEITARFGADTNNIYQNILNDPYLSTLSSDGMINDKIKALMVQEHNQITQLEAAYGPTTDDNNWLVRYVQNTTTGAFEPQFYNRDVLDSANTVYDSTTKQSQSHIAAYKVGSQQKNEEIKGVNTRLEQDATGRIINITLNPGTSEEVTYALTTNTVADQMRYDDAINQYEYDKYQYDQAINEINAKIQIIQTQDKNLELRLKQLDTEQNAIQTEMDAVSKVIQKNVESTFKTFC
jgi:hypothetical protein